MKIRQWLFELLRKQSVTDGRTDGRMHGRTDARTDGRTDNVKTVYPLQTKFAGGIKMLVRIIYREDPDLTASSEAVWSGPALFV